MELTKLRALEEPKKYPSSMACSQSHELPLWMPSLSLQLLVTVLPKEPCCYRTSLAPVWSTSSWMCPDSSVPMTSVPHSALPSQQQEAKHRQLSVPQLNCAITLIGFVPSCKASLAKHPWSIDQLWRPSPDTHITSTVTGNPPQV